LRWDYPGTTRVILGEATNSRLIRRRIPEADLKRVLASHLGYDVKLLLAPGHQRIAFAVRDDVARVSSSVIHELDIDKEGHAAAPAARHPGLR
jgi:hypothetical protein